MSVDKIEQETYITHNGIQTEMLEWAEEWGLDQTPEDIREVLLSAFHEGFSRCLSSTMRPALDLSMILLQLIAIKNQNGDDFKVELSADALKSLEDLCHQIAGIPEQWQLDTLVEPITMPPEDLS